MAAEALSNEKIINLTYLNSKSPCCVVTILTTCVAGGIFIGLGLVHLFGPTGSVGFIASLAAGAALELAAIMGIIWLAKKQCCLKPSIVSQDGKTLATSHPTNTQKKPSNNLGSAAVAVKNVSQRNLKKINSSESRSEASKKAKKIYTPINTNAVSKSESLTSATVSTSKTSVEESKIRVAREEPPKPETSPIKAVPKIETPVTSKVEVAQMEPTKGEATPVQEAAKQLEMAREFVKEPKVEALREEPPKPETSPVKEVPKVETPVTSKVEIAQTEPTKVEATPVQEAAKQLEMAREFVKEPKVEALREEPPKLKKKPIFKEAPTKHEIAENIKVAVEPSKVAVAQFEYIKVETIPNKETAKKIEASSAIVAVEESSAAQVKIAKLEITSVDQEPVKTNSALEVNIVATNVLKGSSTNETEKPNRNSVLNKVTVFEKINENQVPAKPKIFEANKRLAVKKEEKEKKKPPSNKSDQAAAATTQSVKTKEAPKTIHDAVRDRDLNAVKTFIAQQQNLVNQKDSEGRVPLHLAVITEEDLAITEALLEAGANVSEKDDKGRTPLKLAVVMGHIEKVKKLIERGANIEEKDSDGRTPLRLALELDREYMVQLLLSKGANTNVRDSEQLTPLMYCLKYLGPKYIEALVTHNADINAPGQTGGTVLHLVVGREDNSYISELSKYNPDVNAKDNNGRTPLHIAAAFGCVNNVKWLLSKGAKVLERDGQGASALHLAVLKPDNQAVISELLINSTDLEIKDESGQTPLFYATEELATLSNLTFLLDKKADVNAKDNDNMTPLHNALQSDKNKGKNILSMVEKLISKDNLNAKDDKGITPLHLTARHHGADVANLLLKNGARVDETDASARTALWLAAQCNNNEVAKVLIDNKAFLDASEKIEWFTPLHIAAINLNIETVCTLLEKGAFINARTRSKCTALLLLVINLKNQEEALPLIDLFRKYGVDVNAKDCDNYTAFDYCLRLDYSKVLDALNKPLTDVLKSPPSETVPLSYSEQFSVAKGDKMIESDSKDFLKILAQRRKKLQGDD